MSGDNASAEYVLDRNDLVWQVVRDGGMATRAEYDGITSIGIVALARAAGPLLSFEPGSIRIHADLAARLAAAEQAQREAVEAALGEVEAALIANLALRGAWAKSAILALKHATNIVAAARERAGAS